ncbi:alpha/beta fold hydrolase [Fructobacillus ficulneus]|uniref:CitR protein n=1 Tax=Fructobacillus ficulneus TaxID=157463 RepID=A0A0K8MJV8_9LACO|nr:alpha/beta hydrolase [Fructobacillus ficulneus]GAP00160.1 CitR protein [Fructobacillus ficulneus]
MATLTTSDGVALNYTDRPGRGPVAVLLSGYSGIQAEWMEQIPGLLDRGYRVVTMDWRSHGQSERTSKNLRISRLAVDLHELIVHLDLQDITLVGHSMGGSTIWAYLSLFGEDRLHDLVIVDESPKLVNDEDWTAGIRDLTWSTFETIAPTFIKNRLTALPVDQKIKDRLKIDKVANPFNFDLTYPLLKDHLLADWRENLADCTLPTLFVAGGASPLCKEGYFHDFETMLNQESLLKVIQKSGHLPHLESPQEFNEEFYNFIR